MRGNARLKRGLSSYYTGDLFLRKLLLNLLATNKFADILSFFSSESYNEPDLKTNAKLKHGG